MYKFGITNLASHQAGKTYIAMAQSKAMVDCGQRVVIACPDQAKKLQLIAFWFPGSMYLYELVG